MKACNRSQSCLVYMVLNLHVHNYARWVNCAMMKMAPWTRALSFQWLMEVQRASREMPEWCSQEWQLAWSVHWNSTHHRYAKSFLHCSSSRNSEVGRHGVMVRVQGTFQLYKAPTFVVLNAHWSCCVTLVPPVSYTCHDHQWDFCCVCNNLIMPKKPHFHEY